MIWQKNIFKKNWYRISTKIILGIKSRSFYLLVYTHLTSGWYEGLYEFENFIKDWLDWEKIELPKYCFSRFAFIVIYNQG